MMDATRGMHRPELQALDRPTRRRVLLRVRARGLRCPGCGRRSFEVGDALFLGFLFVNAGPDEYRVALTCTSPECPTPRTAVTLHASELLPPRWRQAFAAWRTRGGPGTDGAGQLDLGRQARKSTGRGERRWLHR